MHITYVTSWLILLYVCIYIYIYSDKLDIFFTSHFESLIQYLTLILNNDIAML